MATRHWGRVPSVHRIYYPVLARPINLRAYAMPSVPVPPDYITNGYGSPMQTTSCTWPSVVPIGEDPAAHGHWCAFTDLYHTIPYQFSSDTGNKTRGPELGLRPARTGDEAMANRLGVGSARIGDEPRGLGHGPGPARIGDKRRGLGLGFVLALLVLRIRRRALGACVLPYGPPACSSHFNVQEC